MSATLQPIRIGPNSQPQTKFLTSPADIVVYGGAAGGGKTFGLMLDPIRHVKVKGFRAVFLRRTNAEIEKPGGLLEESINLYQHLGGQLNKNKLTWTFPSGCRYDFDHLQYDSTCINYRSSQIAALYFDQLETFTEYQWWYMFSRNRSVSGVKPYIRATANPDPDCWLRKFIAWWIDDRTGYPIPARDGVLRWFVRVDNELFWADTQQELFDRFPNIPQEELMPLSVTFIKATVYDNVDLMQKNPQYLAKLRAMPLVERMRLLGGNWNIRNTAGNVFKKEWFKVIHARPTDIELVAHCRGWDLAASKKEKKNDPDKTAGTKVGMDGPGRIFILDQRSLWGTPAEVENAIANTAGYDGYGVSIGIEQEGGGSGKGWPDNIIRTRLQGFVAQYFPPQGDKISRAKALSAQAEIGNVYLVNPNPDGHCQWIEELLNEAESFPQGRHDDRVDSMVLAYEMCLGGHGLAQAWDVGAVDPNMVSGLHVPRGVFRERGGEDRHNRGMEDFHGPGEYDQFEPDQMFGGPDSY